ncbi:MAG: hypothetical protein NVS9B4_08040 [Candidatus Acidiferrum sp.]
MDKFTQAGLKRFAVTIITLAAVAVLYASGCGNSTPPAISVAVSPSTAQVIDQGQQKSFTASVANDSASKGVTWTVSGGGTLTGATPTTVTYNAPTAVSANLSVTVTATSAADTTKLASVSVTVTPAPSVSTSSLPAGTVAAAYSQSLQASGGAGSLAWSLASGALPNGLSLSAGGVISGTPTAVATSNFTVQVADSGSPALTATKALSITINPAPLVITTTALGAGTVSSTYSSTLQASGGTTPYTWSVTAGALPAGLALNTATGNVSGVPTTSGTSTFTVTVADSAAPTPQSKSQQFSILVNPVLSVSTASLPNATAGTAYSQQLQSGGGTAPITWSVTLGSLPTGLTLSSGGLISGTPTAPATSNFTVQAADSSTPQQLATKALSIVVDPAPLAITTTTLPSATIGVAYNASVQSSGGTPPVTWAVTVGVLPTGLALNSSTGAITGTPTALGTSTFTVQATDSATPTAQTKTQALSITVNSAVVACGTGSESLLNGQYAMALRGFDANGPVGIGATFNADGTGKIATLVGIEDLNSSSIAGVQKNLSITSASSSYSIGADHRGCLTIATSAGTQTFRFSLGGISGGIASNGHVIQFDSTGSKTAGVLRKQDATAFSTASGTGITGNYAFGASGARLSGGKFAVVGMLSLNSGTVSNSSVADTNDNGNMDNGGAIYPASPISITGGSYSVASSGRGTLSITPSGSPAVNMILYVVSSGEFLTLSSDPQTTNTLFVGSALQQSGGPFTASSLNAPAILYTTGLGYFGGPAVSSVQAGILTFPSSGTAVFAGQQNNGGTIKAQSATGVTYSVASNGRVTFAGGGGGTPIIYLASANRGFALFSDTSLTSPKIQSGFLEPQTGGPFSTASTSGTYAFGTIQPDETGVSDESGIATFASPNVSGTNDRNASGTLTGGSTFGPVSYSVDATGLGVIPAGCNIDGTIGTDGTCQTIFYIVSPTKAVVLDVQASTTPTHPHLQVAEQ